MTIEKQIRDILEGAFRCELLEIENESHNHSRAGSESHFKVVIVSDDFKNLTMLERHRTINELLIDVYKKVHALSIRSYDSSQWQNLVDKPISPLCASKTKR